MNITRKAFWPHRPLSTVSFQQRVGEWPGHTSFRQPQHLVTAIFQITLFIHLACAGSSLLCRLVSVVTSRGCYPVAIHWLPVPWLLLLQRRRLWCAQASGVAARGLSSCGAWARLLRGMLDLPRPGDRSRVSRVLEQVPSLLLLSVSLRKLQMWCELKSLVWGVGGFIFSKWRKLKEQAVGLASPLFWF